MTRYGWTADRQRIRKLSDRLLPRREQLQDDPPIGIAQRLESIAKDLRSWLMPVIRVAMPVVERFVQ